MADKPFYEQENIEPMAPVTPAAPAQPAEPKITVYDHAAKVGLEIPESGLELAIKTGRYTLPKDYQLPIVTPDGEFGTVGAAEAYEALQSGYRMQTAEEKQEISREQQYGDSEIASAALGAASGLTFGLSNQVLAKSGAVSQEALREITERSPVANTVGEVAGVVGGMLGPGAIGRVAGTGVRAVEGAALATEAAVAKQLVKAATKAGVSNPVAKALAAKIAPKAAGSAVEGAFYGTGQLISEDALGTADFNAENLVAAAGVGALLGGALGAGIGAATAAAPMVKSAAALAAKPIKEAAEGLVDRNRAALELVGFTPAKMTKASKELKNGAADFLKDRVGLEALDSSEKLAMRLDELKSQAGTTIDNVLNAAETAGVKADRKIFENLADKIEDTIVKQYKSTPGFETTVNQVQKYADDVRKLVIEAKEFGPRQLQQLRRQTDELISFGKRTGDMPLVQQAAYEVRSELRKTIDDLATQTAPDLGTQLKQANRDYSLIAEMTDSIERKVAKEQFVKFSDVVTGGVGYGIAGPGGVAAAGLLNFTKSDMRRKLVVLSQLERAQQKISNAVNKAVKGFFDPAAKVARPATTMSLLNTDLAADFTNDKPKRPKTRIEAYRNISKNLEMFASNPETLMSRTNRTTSLMYDSAPKTSGASDMVANNAIQFLNSKLPRKNQNVGIFTAMRGPTLPSTLDLAKFDRYLNAIENPIEVLKDFESGRLTREGVEAIKAVYPSIYQKLSDTVMDKIAKEGPNMPYSKKLALGLLLDTPTDESMLPMSIAGLQASFAPQAPESQGAVNPTVGGMKELGKADRLESGSQAVLNRAES